MLLYVTEIFNCFTTIQGRVTQTGRAAINIKGATFQRIGSLRLPGYDENPSYLLLPLNLSLAPFLRLSQPRTIIIHENRLKPDCKPDLINADRIMINSSLTNFPQTVRSIMDAVDRKNPEERLFYLF